LIEADCTGESGAFFCCEQVRGESADVREGVHAGLPIVFVSAERGGACVEYVVDHALRRDDLMPAPEIGHECLSELTATPNALTSVRVAGQGGASSRCRAVGGRQCVDTFRTCALWTDVSEEAVVFQAGE
jgi:hypothetical protein